MSFDTGQWKHHNTNATFVDSAVSCTLGVININTAGASSNTITLYDNGTGTSLLASQIIAVLDGTQVTAGARNYQVLCQNGLTVVSATGTAADFTLSVM